MMYTDGLLINPHMLVICFSYESAYAEFCEMKNHRINGGLVVDYVSGLKVFIIGLTLDSLLLARV